MPPRLPRRLLLVPQDNRLLMRLGLIVNLIFLLSASFQALLQKMSLEELSSLKFHFHFWDLMIQLVWEHQPSKLVLLRIPRFLLILLQVLQRLILLQLLLIPRPLQFPALLQILLLLLNLVPQKVPLLGPRPLLFPWLLQLPKCPRQCQLPKCPRQCQLPRKQTRQLIPVPSQCQKQLSSSQDLL
ncbi:hypothetical protein BDR26DRAFT_875278, partial [Obelidium mucronatum]